MMADRDDGTSAALRRRQRRLRSWWRHEQRSVAAALAAATHHSAPRSGWPEQHNAPRGPTTASAMEGEVRKVHEVLREQKPPLPGMRPAPLSEVAGPLGRLVAPACPSGGVPALVPVVMVQEAAHDDATVSYLLSQTLLAEQEAKEVEELEAELADREHRLMTSIRELRGRYDLRDQFTRLETQVIGWAGIKWEVEKKKEKKRRKKKTPKSSSSRAARTRTSSSVQAAWHDCSGGVMSSVVCGPWILLDIHWLLQHSANTVAYSWSYGVKVATFIRDVVENTCGATVCAGCFAGYDSTRAVFPSFVALADEAHGDSTGAALGQGVMPVVVPSGAFGKTAQKTAEIPQLPFFDKLVQISVVVQRPIPMVVFRPEMVVHRGRYGPQGIFAPFFHVVHMPVVCNDRCLWCSRQCRRSSRTRLPEPVL